MTTEPLLHIQKLQDGGQDRYRLPGGARQLLLVRHGSSVGPTVDTIEIGELTVSDPALSADGELQAEAVGNHLQHEPINHIFVTPLQRTKQTAAPLVALLGIAAIVVPDLRECYLGDWEHSFYHHAETGHPLVRRMFAEESWEVVPGAERMTDFADRVRRGIQMVVGSTEPETTSVVFTHAGTIAEICHQATSSRPFAFTAPENTSVTRIVINAEGSWKLRSFNDVSHLGYL